MPRRSHPPRTDPTPRRSRKPTSIAPAPERVADPLKPRVAGLMRLARKAGRIVIGVALTRDSVRAGRARGVWIADDLLERRSRSLIERWSGSGVAIYRGWTKEELGELAGKPAVAVLSVTDPNIVAGIERILSSGESREREPEQGA